MSRTQETSENPQRSSDERPRVLSVRFGVNPNSSSLGVDVTYLLFGGGFAAATALVLSAFLRGRKALGLPVQQVGDGAGPGPSGASS